MASKDVSIFRFVLPLLLVFFIAAGSAIGCPEHRTTTAYRTKAINSRSVSYMAPVVITYGGPASYQRCTDSRYGTKRVNVPVRRDDYYEGGARYVAVRNYVPRARVIVRDLDYDDASSRYVTVRRQPAYVDS